MKRLLKISVVVITSLVAVSVLVLRFSAVDSRQYCTGAEVVLDADTIPQAVFLRMTMFRWWVQIWNRDGSDGVIGIEVPHRRFVSYDVRRAGQTLQMFYGDQFVGSHSDLSGSLSIHDPAIGFSYRGICGSSFQPVMTSRQEQAVQQEPLATEADVRAFLRGMSTSRQSAQGDLTEAELEEFFRSHTVAGNHAAAIKLRYTIPAPGTAYLGTIHGYPNNLVVCEELIEPYNSDPSLTIIPGGTYYCEVLR